VSYLPTAKNEPARAFIENVAAQHRSNQGERVVYRIPAQEAQGFAHRPGHDPDAVVAASRSGEAKSHARSNPNSSAIGVSARYAELAKLTTGQVVQAAVNSASSRMRELPDAAAPAKTETERRMLMLWIEMTGIQNLGVNDDYFAIGGSSLLAARLFSEISRQFGVKLPLTTILEFPTARALAHRVQQASAWSPALVRLKSGRSRNLFLVHDGDGETLLYANLAGRLPDDHAVFGIEPKRLPSIALAHDSIEAMATWYLKLLREIQPTGPYLLGGMCAGGVIAFEMASQLEREGQVVELLALLDAAAPHATKRPGRNAKLRRERLAHAIHRDSQMSTIHRLSVAPVIFIRKAANTIRWQLSTLFARWSARLRFKLLGRVLQRSGKWPEIIPSLSVRQIYECAEDLFSPRPISTTNTVLVRASFGEDDDTPYTDIYSDRALGWAAFVPNLTIVDVQGGHSSMLQEPFVHSLADALDPFLSERPTVKHLALSVTENA